MAEDASREAAVRRQLAGLDELARATPPPSPAHERIARCVRSLGRFCVTTQETEPELERVARALESLIDELPGGEPEVTSRFEGGALDAARPLANARGTHPLLGIANPVAPPLVLRVADGRIRADVEFGVCYEGNAGWVHGGYVAAGFDIVLVSAARFSGRAGPTGTLQVRYRRPTPVCQPLRYEGWFEREEGRRLHVRGRLLSREGGEPTAEAEGIVVATT